MGFLKSEFTRFFGLGFAGGALLVLGAMGVNATTRVASGIVPAAQAAPAR